MEATNEFLGSQTQTESDDKMAASVRDALKAVKDPEIPTLSLEELGMVYNIAVDKTNVHIDLIPTFVGCPATEFIRSLVIKRVEEVEGVSQVDVSFVMDVPWTTERITEAGRTKLEEFGIAPPPREFSPGHQPVCPYCKAEETHVVSLFGPTACRSVYYCKHCRQPFEGMKYV